MMPLHDSSERAVHEQALYMVQFHSQQSLPIPLFPDWPYQPHLQTWRLR